LEELEELGCLVEGGAMSDVYAINVPRELDFSVVETTIAPHTADGSIDVAYPTVRHVN